MIQLHAADTANGHKAVIVLEELGLAYRVHVLNLMGGEHKSAQYLALNPVGKIPLLIDGDERIYGTLAIGLTLCQRHGKLVPANNAGLFYECLALVATDLGPALSGQFMFANIIPDRPASAVAYFESEIRRYLERLEGYARRSDYLAGNEFTLADALAFPSISVSALRVMDQSEFDETYTGLARWRNIVAQRPSIASAVAACAARDAAS